MLMHRESVDCAQKSKLNLIPLFTSFAEIKSTSLADDSRALQGYGEVMSQVLGMLCDMIKENSKYPGAEEVHGVGPCGQPLFETPLDAEHFLKLYWKVAESAQCFAQESVTAEEATLALELRDLYSSLKEFYGSNATAANFR